MSKTKFRRDGKNEPEKRPPASSKCIDCGSVQTVPRYEFFRAARPKCSACGGLLEYQGSWHKTRSHPAQRS